MSPCCQVIIRTSAIRGLAIVEGVGIDIYAQKNLMYYNISVCSIAAQRVLAHSRDAPPSVSVVTGVMLPLVLSFRVTCSAATIGPYRAGLHARIMQPHPWPQPIAIHSELGGVRALGTGGVMLPYQLLCRRKHTDRGQRRSAAARSVSVAPAR